MDDVACSDLPATAAHAALPSSIGRLQASVAVAATLAVPTLLQAADALSPGAGWLPVTVPPVAQGLSRVQAARLLGQASMGASPVDIASVQALGIAGWVDNQIAMPREISLWDWLVAKGYRYSSQRRDAGLMDIAVWHHAIVGTDQLRQRVGHALLDIFVVGCEGLAGYAQGFAMAAYIDLLMDGAFGSFRDLLGHIAANVSMANFLTFMNSVRADPSTGTHPDENFARELMQLFTIGLYQLNPDGTRKLNGGMPVETYTQEDITGLARVFTGWIWPAGDIGEPDLYRLPLALTAYGYEPGAKTFLGTTIPAGTDGYTSRSMALDTLCAHPNVGPFIGRQLIQRLVTSNPSPAYVGRVAAAFAADANGVRGNLGAVVRAILLDPEARAGDTTAGSGATPDPVWGRLRTPAQRVTNWARAFTASSPSDTWPIGDLSSPWRLLGQSPGHSPSVFNFFRPGYTPPGSPFAAQGLVAPEMQITTEPSLISYVNYMEALIGGGLYANDIVGDYSGLLALNGDTTALLNELNVLLAAGQLSPVTITTLAAAASSIDASTSDGALMQVYAAVLLVLAAPEYLVQK